VESLGRERHPNTRYGVDVMKGEWPRMVTKKDSEGNVVDGMSGDPDEWNNAEWQTVTEDEGYSVDFDQLPNRTFFGTYKGSVTKRSTSLATGEEEDVEMMLFADTNGENCLMWANYRLDEALKSGELIPGRKVKIVHHGKEKIKDGAQEVNRMSVYVKD
jgi:hypothetical protein